MRVIRLLLFLLVAAILLSCSAGQEGRTDDGTAAAPVPAENSGAPEPEAKHAIEVLMINGGGNRSINYQSHLLHLKRMNRLLLDSGFQPDRITIMSADGADPAADLAVREAWTNADAWMLEGTDLANLLRPAMEYKDSKIDGVTLLPATLDSVRQWFDKAVGRLHPKDTLLLYVTDHGSQNKSDSGNNKITLWGRDAYLDVSELRGLLSRLAPGVRVVQLMSQCYSGSFAGLMYRKSGDALPSGDVCGFYSSTPERPAYGCYPESREMEDIGHSFRFIEAVAAGRDFTSAHNQVLVNDDTPDVPIRTSDVYLESLMRTFSKERGQSTDSLIDILLHEAWSDAARWEPEIRLLDRISESFGYFSPRLLSELGTNADELEKVAQAFDYYSRAWGSAFHSLTQGNLQRFLTTNVSWSAEVQRNRVAGLNPEDRNQLAGNLLRALERDTRGNAAIMDRLELLRQNAGKTDKARYRMEVRKAVVLRLRTLLTSIAGRVFIDKYATAAQRTAFYSLSGCETFAPVKAKKQAPVDAVARTFPPYDQELELGKTILPGWMGIRYAPVGDEERNRSGLESGAVTVSAVLPDSPAMEGGLKPGDIVIGPPDEPFSGRDRIREWVMTAPIGIPQVLWIQRGAQRFKASIIPMPEPGRWTDAPAPVKIGGPAPSLAKLRAYRGTAPPTESADGPCLLFFFATWCAPCKASLPALAALEQRQGMPIIAITDEVPGKLDEFFQKQKGFFPGRVMTDESRQSFLAYGVHGTPTFVLIDRGKIRSIKVGYRAGEALSFE